MDIGFIGNVRKIQKKTHQNVSHVKVRILCFVSHGGVMFITYLILLAAKKVANPELIKNAIEEQIIKNAITKEPTKYKIK
jgi:hypothetical protein